MPERKVWRPVRTKLGKNIRKHFNDWLENSEKAKDRIERVQELREEGQLNV